MFFKKYLFIAVLASSAAATRADDFILSYWCGPPASTNAIHDYADVAACGFNYAMYPCSGGDNQLLLNACRKNKLKYLAYDSRLMQFAPENPAFKTNLDNVLATYTKHPALGGYALADEPAPDAFHNLAAVNQYLFEHDPDHLPFINLYPNYVPEGAIGGSYEQYVEKFLTNVRPRLLSFDHYALLDNGTLRPIYFENLEIIRRQALKHDVPFGFIFQLTPHGSYRDLSEDELRWQANTGLIYGARALMYFTYWPPGGEDIFKNRDAIITHDGKHSPHYEQVKRINAAIKSWAPTLMKLKSTGVYHTGELPRATTEYPKSAPVQIKEDAPFIIGTFQHQDGSEWFMIMNRNMHDTATVTLQLDKTIKRLRELSDKNGRLSSAKLRHNELALSFPPGGAKLFRITR